MDKINTYTSTGMKILAHEDALYNIYEHKMGTPVTIQIAPTSKCNLNCSFCSNSKREKDESLDINDLLPFLRSLMRYGLKAIEISGGGDPTCYDRINTLIGSAFEMGLEVGLITNGILLKDRIQLDILDLVNWVRVSMNCLDYVDEIELPKIKGVLGYSYVHNDNTTSETYDRIDKYVSKYNPSYVRIVPNCQVSDEEQEDHNIVLSKMVAKMGEPYFYQVKTFEKPKQCWVGYFKPFLLHDGWIYPCSSVVLNEDSQDKFHPKYRWCRMEHYLDKIKEEMKPFDNGSCTSCVFCQNNNILDATMGDGEMCNFI